MTINGYTLKAIHEFMGMEGMGFNANLYHNGKRIGEVTDTANGSGEIDVYLDMKHQGKHDNVDTDFLERLYRLDAQEQSFKATIKENPDKSLICITLSKPDNSGQYYVEYTGGKSVTQDAVALWYDKHGNGGTIDKIDIFASPDDFNIKDPAESEDMAPGETGMNML